MNRDELVSALDNELQAARFKDYCPNGLQVEGRAAIKRLVTGVTSSQALIDAALEREADVILVHHGLFWRGDDARVVGQKKRRLSKLLAADVNLLAYHLPLDAHPTLGNNAALARVLGFSITGNFGEQSIGFLGNVNMLQPAEALLAGFSEALGRKALMVGPLDRVVKKIAWCTGGAQGYFEEAIAAGCDAYLSGEISEQTTHVARESGVPYFACGHHATERYGVQAVGAWLQEKFGVEHIHIDIDNPA